MILNLDLTAELPEKWVALETVSVIKCLDEDGDPAICFRTTGGLAEWEMVGMLTACSDALRRDMAGRSSDGYHDEPGGP